jgi:hypothetical protein
MSLTGRFQFRKSVMGKIILQVEEQRPPRWSFASRGDLRHRWRDARSLDLALPAIRGLIELWDYIQECPQANYGLAVAPRVQRRWGQGVPQDTGLPAEAGGSSERGTSQPVKGVAQR